MPFYIGVLLIVPIAVQAAAARRKKLPNGYGVGSIMTADRAILHEAIKENIRQQALLVWVDAQGEKATHQAAQAIEALINNIRYVSIENTWFKIIREVSQMSLFRKAIAGAGAMVKHNEIGSVGVTQRQGAYPDQFTAPAAGTELFQHAATEKAQQKVAVTAFADTQDLAGVPGGLQPGYPEMAMVVECFQAS